jgi:hypothetical protein
VYGLRPPLSLIFGDVTQTNVADAVCDFLNYSLVEIGSAFTQTNDLIHLSLLFFRFCGLKGNEMFCEVERSYIEDGFNLYGLRACVSNFSDCLDLILDRIGPDDDSDDSHLTQSACTLYGLIHARYIITAHGLDAMYSKVSTRPGADDANSSPFTHHWFLLSFLLLSSMLQKSLVPVRWCNVRDSLCCQSALMTKLGSIQ